jgi:hypothetical protein
MKCFKLWTTIAIATIFSLLVALQPAISYACGGTHGGC